MALLDPYANQYNVKQAQGGLSGYAISSAYGITGTVAPYISTILSGGTKDIYFDYVRDRPLTNAEWLDRRVDEMLVRL